MRTLLSAEEIAKTVARMGREISDCYAGQPLTLIGVLSGSVIFLADLMRQITIPHQIGFVQASSYRGEATEAGRLELDETWLPTIAGRHVLIVDDILDSGQTLAKLQTHLATLNPLQVKSAVLLKKRRTRAHQVTADFIGFEIEDEFVIGYGLDYDDEYRHLPRICVLPPRDQSATK